MPLILQNASFSAWQEILKCQTPIGNTKIFMSASENLIYVQTEKNMPRYISGENLIFLHEMPSKWRYIISWYNWNSVLSKLTVKVHPFIKTQHDYKWISVKNIKIIFLLKFLTSKIICLNSKEGILLSSQRFSICLIIIMSNLKILLAFGCSHSFTLNLADVIILTILPKIFHQLLIVS